MELLVDAVPGLPPLSQRNAVPLYCETLERQNEISQRNVVWARQAAKIRLIPPKFALVCRSIKMQSSEQGRTAGWRKEAESTPFARAHDGGNGGRSGTLEANK